MLFVFQPDACLFLQIGDVQIALEHIFHRSVVAGAKSNHGHVWPEGRSICESGGPQDEDTDLGGAALADEESLLEGTHPEKHFVLTKIKDRCEYMFFGHTALLIINNTLLRMPLHMQAIYISWTKPKKPSFSFFNQKSFLGMTGSRRKKQQDTVIYASIWRLGGQLRVSLMMNSPLSL